MFPIVHFLTSLVLFIIVYPLFGVWGLAVFIGGFLIDVDHYLYHAIERRVLNPSKCYKQLTAESKKNKKTFRSIKKRPLYIKWDRLHIFHVWEFWLLIVLLSLIYKLFLIVTIGLALHILLDFIDLFIDRVYGRRAISYFGWLSRHKIKR